MAVNAIKWMVWNLRNPVPAHLYADKGSRLNGVMQMIRDSDGVSEAALCRDLDIPPSQMAHYLRMLVDGDRAWFDGHVWREA